MSNLFIVGTGRSGTHFLCQSLIRSANIVDFLGGREDRRLLEKVTLAAINHRDLPRKVISYYRELIENAPGHFVDQCHPNIWHVEQLRSHFPDSHFLIPMRRTASIVYSMFQHRGVLERFGSLKPSSPYPNQFFGIDSYSQFCTLSLLEKCVRRIVSHKLRARRLQSTYPDNVILVDYDRLVLDHSNYLPALLERMGIEPQISNYLPVTKESVQKYLHLGGERLKLIDLVEEEILQAPSGGNTKLSTAHAPMSH